MIPKVGDVVKLNHDFLKVWFRNNKYLIKEVWKEKFTITEAKNLEDEFKINFKSKNSKYNLYVLSNGEFPICRNKYKGIQVFIKY